MHFERIQVFVRSEPFLKGMGKGEVDVSLSCPCISGPDFV